MARADIGTLNFTDDWETSTNHRCIGLADLAQRVLAAIERRCPRTTESELAAFAKLTSIFHDDTDCHCYFTLYMLPHAMGKAFQTLESGTVASLVFNFHNFILLTHTNIKADMSPLIRQMPYRYLSLIHDVLQKESIGQDYGLETHADTDPFPFLYNASRS